MIKVISVKKIFTMNKQIGLYFFFYYLIIIIIKKFRYSIADDIWQSKENRDKAVKNLITEQ